MPSWTFTEGHVEKIPDSNHAKCNYCQAQILYRNGSTASILHHLHSRHQIDPPKRRHPEAGGNAAGTVINLQVPQRNLHHLNAIKDACVLLMANNQLPLSMFDTEEMKHLCVLLQMVPPSKEVVAARGFEMEKALMEKLKSSVFQSETAGKFCITVDEWIGVNGSELVDFLGITGHRITENWELESFMLSLRHLDLMDFEAATLARELEQELNEIGLDSEKIQTVVTNGDLELVSAVKNVLKLPHSHSFSRIMNLAIHDVLGIEERTVNRKKVEIQMTHNPLLAKVTQTLIKLWVSGTKLDEKIPELSRMHALLMEDNYGFQLLVKNCSTRWNSALQLLRRMKQCRNSIESLAARNIIQSEISETDWKEIDELIELLAIFELVFVELEHEKVPSCSLVLPLLMIFNTELRGMKPTHPLVKKTHSEIFQLIMKRIPNHAFHELATASYLDPRFKSLGFLSPTYQPDKIGMIQQQVMENLRTVEPIGTNERHRSHQDHMPQPQSKHPKLKGNSSWYQAQFGVSLFTPVEKHVHAEFERYARLPLKRWDLILLRDEGDCAKKEDSLLSFWKVHEQMFPMLAKFARTYHNQLVSSQPAERLFSDSQNEVTTKQCSRDPKMLQMMMRLSGNHEWLQRWGIQSKYPQTNN